MYTYDIWVSSKHYVIHIGNYYNHQSAIDEQSSPWIIIIIIIACHLQWSHSLEHDIGL